MSDERRTDKNSGASRECAEAVRRMLQDHDNCGELLQATLDYARASIASETQQPEPAEHAALEPAQCAYVNLNNMVKMMPMLGRHPLLPMVKAQLRAAIEHLGGKEFCDMEDGNG